MEKKYYNVYYSNVNVEGEPKLSVGSDCGYEPYGYIVKENKKRDSLSKKASENILGNQNNK